MDKLKKIEDTLLKDVLGDEADSIIRDIKNIAEIVGEWGPDSAAQFFPGCMLPVVLDAANRAAVKELEALAEQAKKGPSSEVILMLISVRLAHLGTQIANRKANEAVEKAA